METAGKPQKLLRIHSDDNVLIVVAQHSPEIGHFRLGRMGS